MSDGAGRFRGDGLTRGQTVRPLDLRRGSGPWHTPKKRNEQRTTGPGEPQQTLVRLLRVRWSTRVGCQSWVALDSVDPGPQGADLISGAGGSS
ncbi:hypothetical protein NDU88_005791 [Pleurodeles waltl]|uniref:Uncharacterized protein n=1 Tax=Pleurodeles waltl TaxID=8319 RepID=A0AAV7NRD6_PLEWA|nr:hypothetical protein NDU88_005791 [Pleurodeles waltl]